MYSFEVRPERRADFAEWAHTRGVPFWLSRTGLISYRTFRVHAGSATSLAMAEFESAEALDQMLDTSEWASVLADFQSYVCDVHSWVLARVRPEISRSGRRDPERRPARAIDLGRAHPSVHPCSSGRPRAVDARPAGSRSGAALSATHG